MPACRPRRKRSTAMPMFMHGARGALTLLVLAAGVANAAAWPARPIVMTVIGGPGSPPDLIARELGERVGQALGQPIVVDNAAGGGGLVGMDKVRRAAPDGYTFVLSHTVPLTVNPSLFKSLPYDPLTDFEPVSMLTGGPMILVVTPALGPQTYEQLVEVAKAKPRALFYGSTGVATPSNIFFEQFKASAGVAIEQVSFKGPTGLMQALLADQVSIGMESYAALGGLLTSGKVRALAVSGETRMGVLPSVPTFKELGVPGIGVSWMAVLAPKGTPPDIVASMHRELTRALNSPEIRRSYEAQGRQIFGSTPAELAALMRSEVPRWRDVINKSGITVN